MVVCSNSSCWLYDAADANDMVRGRLGDVQYASRVRDVCSGHMMTATYDPDLIVNAHTLSSPALYVPTGMEGFIANRDKVGIALPSITSERSIAMVDEVLSIQGLSGVTVTLRIALDNVQIESVLQSTICPTLNGARVFGCYACTQGASIVVGAYSTCGGGLTTVTSTATNLYIGGATVLLGTSPDYVTIGITSPKAEVDTRLCFSGLNQWGTFEKCIDVYGVLDEVIPANKASNASTPGSDVIHPHKSTPVLGWFDTIFGLGFIHINWLRKLLMALLYSTLIISFCYWLFRTVRGRRKVD